MEPPVMRDVLVTRWSEIGDKIVKLAEEFPEDKYDARPVPDIRSFADQLRHVAFWNRYVHKTLRREEADGQANELPRASYPTKAKIVKAVRSTFDDVTKEFSGMNGSASKADADTMVSFIEHGGEHYGQLVVYARLAGVVPPASRA
jgi:DinB superfamily